MTALLVFPMVFSFQSVARFLFSILAIIVVSLTARADLNTSVKELMQLLKPVKASKKAHPDDFKNAQDRMIKIIEMLERFEGAGGRDAKHILTNAFYIYDRQRFSGHRRMLTESTITQCWKKARELGLFDQRNNNKFGFLIRAGREKDKKAKFEYIVPPKVNGSFSTDLANIRLVSPSTARKSEKLTPTEAGHLTSLELFEKEILHGRPDKMGRTAAENLALWEAEVEKSGGDYKKAPLIRIGGKVTATPSSLSGDRWRVTFEASNLSRHPTEITVEFYLFGMTERGGKIYLLKKGKKNLKLRRTHQHDFDVYSDEKVGAIDFRGWVIHIRHDGKIIDKSASQSGIEKLVAAADRLPRMVKPKPRSGKR